MAHVEEIVDDIPLVDGRGRIAVQIGRAGPGVAMVVEVGEHVAHEAIHVATPGVERARFGAPPFAELAEEMAGVQHDHEEVAGLGNVEGERHGGARGRGDARGIFAALERRVIIENDLAAVAGPGEIIQGAQFRLHRRRQNIVRHGLQGGQLLVAERRAFVSAIGFLADDVARAGVWHGIERGEHGIGSISMERDDFLFSERHGNSAHHLHRTIGILLQQIAVLEGFQQTRVSLRHEILRAHDELGRLAVFTGGELAGNLVLRSQIIAQGGVHGGRVGDGTAVAGEQFAGITSSVELDTRAFEAAPEFAEEDSILRNQQFIGDALADRTGGAQRSARPT